MPAFRRHLRRVQKQTSSLILTNKDGWRVIQWSFTTPLASLGDQRLATTLDQDTGALRWVLRKNGELAAKPNALVS